VADVILVFVVWVGIAVVACWHQLQTVKEQKSPFFKFFVVSSKVHNGWHTVQQKCKVDNFW